jgi:hypothetical protein
VNGVALVLWIITAFGGLTMVGIWIANRGPSQHRDGNSRLSPGRVGLHFGFAAVGLALWIIHTATDNTASGWIALLLLPVAAVIGFIMLMTWLAGRGASTIQVPPEQHIPAGIVAAHGMSAVLTLTAVFVALIA